jgi:curved DNA-binding protein CbpA
MQHDELFELRLVVDELYDGLATYPYHVFLGVDPDLRGDALRTAFHRRAAQFHPDQYYSLPDAALREKIYAVYKRITEAYRVLSDPETRRRWEQQRARGALRLESTGRFRSWRPEEGLSEPARKYYILAADAERRGDVKNARFNLQLAIQFDPDNSFLQDKLEKLK